MITWIYLFPGTPWACEMLCKCDLSIAIDVVIYRKVWVDPLKSKFIQHAACVVGKLWKERCIYTLNLKFTE
jgi:hypothetical protein